MRQPRHRRQGPVGLPGPLPPPLSGGRNDLRVEPLPELEHPHQLFREGIAGPIGTLHPRHRGEGAAEAHHRITRNGSRLRVIYIEHTFDTITTYRHKPAPTRHNHAYLDETDSTQGGGDREGF